MGAWQVAALVAIGGVVVATLYFLFADDWLALEVRRAVRRPLTYVVGVPTFLAVMLVGVPFVYIQATESPAPPPLSFDDMPDAPSPTVLAAVEGTVPAPSDDDTSTTETSVATATTVATGAAAPSTTLEPATGVVDGRWVVGRGSEARYDIDDVILGQSTRVVGRTDQVTGDMQIANQAVTAAHVVVDMRSIHCDCVHDSKYHDLLDTDQYPTSTFALTSPIAIASIPADGTIVHFPVQGDFTIHGTTRHVKLDLAAVRRNGRIAVNGRIPVRLEDYGIENPQAGAFGGLNDPAIDLLVIFDPA